MYCPLGYITVSSLMNDAWEKRVPEAQRSLLLDSIRAKQVHERFERMAFFDASPADYVENRLIDSVSEHLYIAPASGDIRKLDGHLFAIMTNTNQFSVSNLWQQAKHNGVADYSLDRDLQSFLDLFDLEPDLFWDDFQSERALNPDLDAWTFWESLYICGYHQKIPMFHERIGYSISLAGYNLANQYDGVTTHEMHGVARLLRQTEGWILCVPDAYARSEAFARDMNRSSMFQPPREVRRRGRPPKPRGRVVEAYLSLCPEGIPTSQWGDLANRIGRIIGEPIHQKTLRNIVEEARSAGTLARMLENKEEQNPIASSK